MSPRKAAVVGVHHTPLRRRVDDQSLEEMIFAAARGALVDAGLTIDDIDAIAISTTDQVEGRVIESMVTVGAAGGVGRDVTTLASAGEHALVYAYIRIAAAQAKRVLVVVWSKASEAVNPAHADRLTAEPFLLRPLGMSSNTAAGLQASSYLNRYGLDVSVASAVREARMADAIAVYGDAADSVQNADDFVAWPLTAADLPRACDAAVAAVIVAADAVTSEQSPAWIDGVGWISDRYDLGERDLSRFDSLAAAAHLALGDDLAGSMDVVEVQEISSIGALAAYEALGLAKPGNGLSVAFGRNPAVNPSGGSLPLNPGNASGFLRIVSAAQQIRGRSGAAQLIPRPRSAVGAALHGFAGQSAAVVSFAAERGE